MAHDRASRIKVHPHAAGARGGNQEMGITKRRLNSKIHMAVDAHCMPVRVLVTAGTQADRKEAVRLIEGISAKALLADHGYDADEIATYALNAGIEVVIPFQIQQQRTAAL